MYLYQNNSRFHCHLQQRQSSNAKPALFGKYDNDVFLGNVNFKTM